MNIFDLIAGKTLTAAAALVVASPIEAHTMTTSNAAQSDCVVSAPVRVALHCSTVIDSCDELECHELLLDNLADYL